MGVKNLLSDTDFTRGHDTRFANAVSIGYVTKIECTDKHANVRVILPDRKDHEGTPMITKPIPVMQICSAAKKQFAMPRIDAPVMLIKLPNGTADYLVVGAFYTQRNPPPVSDPLLDYTEWEGGHIQKFDANDGAAVFLTQDFKGGWNATIKKDVNFKTTDGAKFNINADGDVLINSANGNITIQSPTGTILIEQQEIDLTATTIKLTGNIIIDGNITHTGNMTTSGVHTDVNGHHTTAAARESELLARIEALEQRLAKLEART
jgi:phage baseplate assembly protein V